jgi:hypothetical protein
MEFPTSKSTWKPNFVQIGGFLYFVGHFGFKMAAIANQQWISIRNIIIYLETKFHPNRRIFVVMIHFVGISTIVCGSFWGVEKNQNGGRCHGNQGIK